MSDEPRKALTAADVLAAPRVRPQWVDVPEWGGGVYVRALMAGELDDLQLTLGDEAAREDRNFRGRVVALCACDADGHPLFTEADAGRIAQLDAPPVNRVFLAAQRLNGFGAEGVGRAEKN